MRELGQVQIVQYLIACFGYVMEVLFFHVDGKGFALPVHEDKGFGAGPLVAFLQQHTIGDDLHDVPVAGLFTGQFDFYWIHGLIRYQDGIGNAVQLPSCGFDWDSKPHFGLFQSKALQASMTEDILLPGIKVFALLYPWCLCGVEIQNLLKPGNARTKQVLAQ